MIIREAQGHSDGIWFLSFMANISFQVLDSHPQVVSICCTRGGVSWLCSAVYGSPIPVIRDSLWTYFNVLRQRIQESWSLLGDFNEVLQSFECLGGNFISSRASCFVNCLDACNLIDLGMVGGRFTWVCTYWGYLRITKKLDKVVADCSWRVMFLEAYMELFSRNYSNHSPILLRFHSFTYLGGNKPFRFEVA